MFEFADAREQEIRSSRVVTGYQVSGRTWGQGLDHAWLITPASP